MDRWDVHSLTRLEYQMSSTMILSNSFYSRFMYKYSQNKYFILMSYSKKFTKINIVIEIAEKVVIIRIN